MFIDSKQAFYILFTFQQIHLKSAKHYSEFTNIEEEQGSLIFYIQLDGLAFKEPDGVAYFTLIIPSILFPDRA